MPVDEMDVFAMMKRLEKLENAPSLDIAERLAYIEKQLRHFVYAVTSIDERFKTGVRLYVDEKMLDLLSPLKDAMNMIKTEMTGLVHLRKSLAEQIKHEAITGPLEFMGKRLHELTIDIHTIKEEGIKKQIHLDLTMDGYEMVKKKSPKTGKDCVISDDSAIIELFAILTDREALVLKHRYGLLGEKQKTLKAAGEALNISRERVSNIQCKALRRCRHPNYKHLTEQLTHLELRKDILGK